MSYTIYAIIHPQERAYLYVGQTSDYRKRIQNHLKNAKGKRLNIGTQNIRTALCDLYQIGLLPEFEILEETECEESSLQLETIWIRRLAAEGHPLLNRWAEHRKLIKSQMFKKGQKTSIV